MMPNNETHANISADLKDHDVKYSNHLNYLLDLYVVVHARYKAASKEEYSEFMSKKSIDYLFPQTEVPESNINYMALLCVFRYLSNGEMFTKEYCSEEENFDRLIEYFTLTEKAIDALRFYAINWRYKLDSFLDALIRTCDKKPELLYEIFSDYFIQKESAIDNIKIPVKFSQDQIYCILRVDHKISNRSNKSVMDLISFSILKQDALLNKNPIKTIITDLIEIKEDRDLELFNQYFESNKNNKFTCYNLKTYYESDLDFDRDKDYLTQTNTATFKSRDVTFYKNLFIAGYIDDLCSESIENKLNGISKFFLLVKDIIIKFSCCSFEYNFEL